MIHYHGGPFSGPESVAYRAWAGRHGFVSWSEPKQLQVAATVCQSFALDNGAFSLWKSGTPVDWCAYYDWCAEWLNHPACDWAVIPDVIGGTENENDAALAEWPFGHRGVPVWHLNESPDRLAAIAEEWPRVAIGSAAEYDVSSPARCLARLREVLPAICDAHGRPRTKLHGLRMLNPAVFTRVPLASADSTNAARNCGLDSPWRGTYAPASVETRALVLVERIEQHQSLACLADGAEQESFALIIEEATNAD